MPTGVKVVLTAELERRVRDCHDRQLWDAQIARELGLSRPTIHKLRRWLGLSAKREHYQLGKPAWWKVQGQRTPSSLRREATVAALGWPLHLPSTAARILTVLWEEGPRTRHELATRLGFHWRGSSTFLWRGTTLTKMLRQQHLIVVVGKIKEGRKHENVYAIPFWVERGPVS